MHDCVDAMRLLFAKTRYPAEGQACSSQQIYQWIEQQIQEQRAEQYALETGTMLFEIAPYFGDLDIGSSPEKAPANAKGRNTGNGMAKLTNKFVKLALP